MIASASRVPVSDCNDVTPHAPAAVRRRSHVLQKQRLLVCVLIVRIHTALREHSAANGG
jgi:hypothetical protein